MRYVCSQCERVYTDDVGRCPHDNAELLAYEDPASLIGLQIDGRFEVRELLGVGGMGAVYLARQVSIDRLVALKVIKRELLDNVTLVKRFFLEAKAASSLKNPHTITIHDFGRTSDGLLYIAMEYLEGESLRARLNVAKVLGLDETLTVLAGVAESLSEAHQQGLVHRDIKPENVFLAATSSDPAFPMVLDFGIVRSAAVAGVEKLTRTATLIGTPTYMSPEAALGEEIDARADVYSLGIMMYEMLTGEVPFRAATPMQVLMAHVNEKPRPVAVVNPDVAIPSPVHDLLWRCLAKERDKRPRNGGEFLAELKAARSLARRRNTGVRIGELVSTGEGFRGQKGAFDQATTKKRGGEKLGFLQVSRHRALLVGGAVLLVTALVLGLLLGRGTPTEDSSRRAEPVIHATPPPVSVVVTVLSNPSGAHVIDGNGVDLGVTPLPLRLEVSETGRRYGVRLAGYAESRLRVVPDRDKVVPVELVELEPETPPSPKEVDAPTAVDTRVPAASTTAVVDEVRIAFETEPPNATVKVRGKAIGKSPVTWKVKRSDEPVRVILEKPGYAPKSLTVRPSRDRTERHTLAPDVL